jgi:hypothetical protein
LTVLEYQMSSPHCPDRTTNAHTGTNECGHLTGIRHYSKRKKRKVYEQNVTANLRIKLILSHAEGPHTFPNSFHAYAGFQQLNTFGVAFNYVAATPILVLCH